MMYLFKIRGKSTMSQNIITNLAKDERAEQNAN